MSIPIEPINQGIVAGFSFLIPVAILVIIIKMIVSSLEKRKKDNMALFLLIGILTIIYIFLKPNKPNENDKKLKIVKVEKNVSIPKESNKTIIIKKYVAIKEKIENNQTAKILTEEEERAEEKKRVKREMMK